MRLERLNLTINGVERFVTFEPEKDSLAEVLRRMGLTGVKVGCNSGACGACSVLLDGEVVRSCARKMKRVREYSEITTIEGIGNPQHLHPIQQAWITYGGAQCGFCSPGFIVSAYGLLQKNPAPTREDVRSWFKAHHNVCRCTGYVPLVDAVMAAAEVMRGEKSMKDITYDFEGETEVYGSRRPRPTALAKVTGLADFGDDVARQMPPGVAHLAVVMAQAHHADIVSIDTSQAEAMPGVIGVLTGKDVKGTNDLPAQTPNPRQRGDRLRQFPVIADKKICRRGDVVALVAADTREHAREAAAKVTQNLEVLPTYLTFPEAVLPGAVDIHSGIPNFFMEQPVFKGEDTAGIFEDAAVVAEASFHSQHEPHLTIEPDTLQGYWGTDGMLTLQCKSHNFGEARDALSVACGIERDRLRMLLNTSGGAFGYSICPNVFALVVTAVQNLDMPCTLTLSYDEFNHVTGKRMATFANGRIACDEDGKIIAAEYDVASDHGAYDFVPTFLNLTSLGFHGYNIPNFKALGRGGTSNHNFNTSYRGFGVPQISTTTEALIDMCAEKAGIDPWQFRYRNAARPGDLTINSRPYLHYLYPALLEKAKPTYDAYKAEAETGRAAGRHAGVGMSMGGFVVTIGMFDVAEVALELNPDGGITHYNTWEDMGQGGDIGTLTHTVKALEPLGIKPDRVRLVMNDSKICPDTGLAAASRSHYVAGLATIDAADKLMNAMRKDDGTWRTHAEMLAAGIPTKYIGHHDQLNMGLDPALDPNTGEGNRVPAFMYGVNVALVEVDVTTGKTQVLRYTWCGDVGVVGNMLSVEGQAYGGISHSIGFALSEDYGAEDRHGSMAGCGIPQIDAIPDDIQLIFQETPRELGPHGSSGCSEVFQSCNHMAVINAIVDACGVRVYDLPATPDKVKAGWEAVQRGDDLTPPKYFLGSDFEDELEWIKANPV